mgnify:CR=1 FL=1
MMPIRAWLIAGMLPVLALPASALGEEVPRRAAGQWEIAVTVAGQPSAHVDRYCIGAEDRLAVQAGAGIDQSDCSEASAERTADGIAIRSVCRQGNSTVTMTGLLAGDLATAYRGDITRTYSPPLYGRSEVKSSVEAKRLGDCP